MVIARTAATTTLLASLLAGSAAATSAAPEQRALAKEQLLLVSEASRVLREVGDDLWKDWPRVPHATLIIDADREFLLNLPRNTKPPVDFMPGDQEFMGVPVYSRARHYPETLRTAVPLGAVPAAVVGAWRPDVESPNEWVVTLVEQWFRVLQLVRGEEAKIADLGIPGYDTQSWDIDYPFPFEDVDVSNAMLLLGQSLYDFWSGGPLPREQQRAFLAETAVAALHNLRIVLQLKHGDVAWRYFQLQVWRDGVARYSGIGVAREIARAEVLDGYRQIDGFDLLPQRKTYVQTWEENIRSRFWMIRTSGHPSDLGRTSFHSLGHGIAELLDGLDPAWKLRYFDRGVWLDDLLVEALRS